MWIYKLLITLVGCVLSHSDVAKTLGSRRSFNHLLGSCRRYCLGAEQRDNLGAFVLFHQTQCLFRYFGRTGYH
ncbi:hypothetical protein EDB86DRAFT_2974740, partial [Lactarius hatsudake]